uniref:RNA-dependent RNA polymerase n=1 Tax=Lhasa Parti tick virus 1 TaxID=2972273 RepID=A0A9E8AAI4_9VIRU|nr:MAG: RNA-dependent RNA polymerase [Lhasa Parti tick virus 1]
MRRHVVYRDMDRPTFNSLTYLTTVRPHPLHKDPRIVDPYVYTALKDLIGRDPIEAFGRYTRSFYTLEGHYSNLWKYDKVITPKPEDPLLDQAIEVTRRAFDIPPGVFSYGFNEFDKVPYIPSSSAGWGYVGKKGDADNHSIAKGRAHLNLMMWIEDQELLKHGAPRHELKHRYSPDMAWTRTQLASPEAPKIRHVWGKAFHNIILEGLSAAPLIQYYQNKSKPMVVGIHLYKTLPMIIRNTLFDGERRRIGIGLDMSSFDTCPMPWLINTAFDIVKSNLVFKDWQSREAFEYTRHYFIETPVIMPDGRMWLKKLGVPSGSYYTQLIDSIINHIVVSYIQLKIWHETYDTYVLGDDSLFGIPDSWGYPDLDKIAEIVESIGFTLSKDKCIISTNPTELEFLGHVAKGIRVDREWIKVLRMALYPEREVTGPELSLARVWGLLIDSALNNPALIKLYEYMKFVLFKGCEPKEVPPEDSNWLRAVVGIDAKPKDFDLLKVWTLT